MFQSSQFAHCRSALSYSPLHFLLLFPYCFPANILSASIGLQSNPYHYRRPRNVLARTHHKPDREYPLAMGVSSAGTGPISRIGSSFFVSPFSLRRIVQRLCTSIPLDKHRVYASVIRQLGTLVSLMMV